MEFFDTSKSIVENLYFLSGIFILLSLIIGIIQLSLGKSTLSINSKRDAAKLAAQQLDIYAKSIIPLQDELNKLEDNRHMCKIRINNTEISWSYILANYDQNQINQILDERRTVLETIVPLLNSMEVFSLYFIKGIADEDIAFSCVGETFVNSVTKLYFDIAIGTQFGNKKSYYFITELYKLWKDKLDRNNLENQYLKISEQLKKSNPKNIKPIGV